jgi:hypothetical protein
MRALSIRRNVTKLSVQCSRIANGTRHQHVESVKPPAHVSSHMTAVHILPSCLFERRFSIILPTKLLPFFPRGFHIKTQHAFPLSTVCKVRPTHLIVLRFITLIIFSTEYKSWNSLCNILQPRFTSYLVGPHVFFSTLFSLTHSFCI